MATREKWDEEADVVVVGTGGGALSAAVLAHDNGAKVLVVEKGNKVGGTTAVSGGGIWIPLNHHMQEIGATDSREDALTYAKRLTAGKAPDEMVEVFIDTGPEMVRYMEEKTAVKFSITHIPDYHAQKPGGRMSGRTLEAELFDQTELGEWANRLRRGPTMPVPIKFDESIYEYKVFARPGSIPMDLIAERMDKGFIATGAALAGRLLKSVLDRSIPVLLNTRGRQLIVDDERIAGVRCEREGKDFFVKAPVVILACGGFEWNERLKDQFLSGPIAGTCSPPHMNEGDGLIMAMEVGADLGNMSEGWLSPGTFLEGQEYEGEAYWHNILADRSLPHSIIVNRYGKRFADEAVNYNDLGKAFQVFDPHNYEYPNSPGYLIIDSQYRGKYPFLGIMPGDPDPDWLIKDDTIAGLARKLGIDPQAVEATVERWNGFVSKGKDEDFGRGESPISAYFGGDPAMPNPNMGSIEKPPFYSHKIEVGFMGGTNGGPRTNTRAQVLNVRGEPIPGLYAAGNTMASVCGPSYYGGGATIGQSMTFGYLAGIHGAKEAKARKG